MKKLTLVSLIFLYTNCEMAIKNKPVIDIPKINNSKERSPVIEKDAKFIYLKLEVYPFSKDSIIVKTILKNNSQKEFRFYRSLLPYDNATEALFSILEKKSYDPVEFNGKNKEKYLEVDSELTDYIIPELKGDKFITLQPNQFIEITSNIAKKYSFDKFLRRKKNEFSIIYVNSFPYIVDGKQVTELDAIDNKLKPVYYIVTGEKNKNPDLMRVFFKVPL